MKAALKKILNAFYKHFDLFDIAWNASHLLTNEAPDIAYGTCNPTFRISGLDNIFVVPAPSAHDYANYMPSVSFPMGKGSSLALNIHTGSQIHPVTTGSSSPR